MHDKPMEWRAGDRRRAQQPFDGPERRLADRRLPDGAPRAQPAIALLSDIDLHRAWLRVAGQPAATETRALAAEMKRRGLSF